MQTVFKILINVLLLIGLFAVSSCEEDENNDFTPSDTIVLDSIVLDSIIDVRDGEVYKTVKIGNQTWMAENLRYNASGSWLNPINPSVQYGRLYDWGTVMNGASSSSSSPSGVQGICPSGWHVPSDAEWATLENAIGGNAVGTAMKSTSGWSNYYGNSGNGFGWFG